MCSLFFPSSEQATRHRLPRMTPSAPADPAPADPAPAEEEYTPIKFGKNRHFDIRLASVIAVTLCIAVGSDNSHRSAVFKA